METQITYPTTEVFTLSEVVQQNATIAKPLVRATIQADVQKGVLKITGSRKTGTGRGRPAFLYAKV